MTLKVLLDTDIGSDIDDAVALAYLLAQPECELLGITTVSGEAAKRAQLASALCKVAGRDIPIFPGREAPCWWRSASHKRSRRRPWAAGHTRAIFQPERLCLSCGGRFARIRAK